MQETKYGIRLAQEDFRWMLGEADLGNMLAPFSTSAMAPVNLEASSQPQLALRSALYTLSVDINALTQEQVRLRETLETLNSTLFINSDSLAPKSANTQTSTLKDEPAGPAPVADKSAGDELLDTARDKIVEKLIDLVFDGAVEKFKGRKKNSRPKAPLPGPSKTESSIPGGSQLGVHAGAPSQGFQYFAGAKSPAPVPTPPSVSSSALKDTFAKLESIGIRRLAPLRTAEAAVDVIQGVRNGDSHAVAAGLSTAGGAWAGASAGAAIGTLILPGVGTAVGGVIGGLLGGEAGAWMGDKLFGSPDRLPTPNAVSKELNNARADSVQISIAPSIHITGVNPADARVVVNQVIQALQFQCMPMVADVLGQRRNAALSDPSGGD